MKLDELDHNIISLLRENGRQSNQELSKKLDTTAATVRSRIRRMEDANVMRVVAITDFSAVGYDLLVMMGIQVQGRSALAVAEDISKLDEVFSVNVVTGQQDIEIVIGTKDIDSLNDLMNTKLARIKGILSQDPGLAIDVIKYMSEVASLTSDTNPKVQL